MAKSQQTAAAQFQLAETRAVLAALYEASADLYTNLYDADLKTAPEKMMREQLRKALVRCEHLKIHELVGYERVATA